MFFTRQLAKRPKRVAGKMVLKKATQSQSGETAIDKTAFKNPKQIKVWKNAMELMKNNLANKIPKGETPFLISLEKRFFSCMISRIERERANQFAERIRANAAIHKEEFFEKVCEKRNPIISGCKNSAKIFPLSLKYCLHKILK